MSADLSGFLWPFHLQSAFLRCVQQCPLKQCFDSSQVWMTSFVSTPAFRPGLVSQSNPGQNVNALLLEVHGHRKFDLSLPVRVLQCGPLESIRQEKCVQLRIVPVVSSQPFSLLLIWGNQVRVCPPFSPPNCLEVPKQIKLRQLLCTDCPVRSSLCPLPGAASCLFFGTIKGICTFHCGHSSHSCLFVFHFLPSQVLLLFSNYSEVRQMDWFLLAKMKFKNHLKVNGKLRCFS